MPSRLITVTLGLAAVLVSTTALAQDAAEIKTDATAQVPERDSDTAELGFLAKARRWAEEKKIAERISPREGLYARFGGMTTGSGFAMGPGYRRYFRDDDMFVDFSGAISTKAYKALDANVRWTRFWNDRVELWSGVHYRDYPEEDFFGVGPISETGARVNYSIESTDIMGRGVVNLARWMRVGADIGYLQPDVGHGADPAYPSIEEIFNDFVASGLTNQPDFLHQTLFLEVDTRDKKTPTRGGFYRASFGTWEDTTLEQYDHHRFDAEASHFFPVMGPKHVVGARLGLSYVNNETGHRVPFYFLPYVGGSDTLRGYREFRYRDENVLFVNLEYRWRALPHLDVAPFFDAGEVRADWEDIGPTDLRTSYGIGFRFNVEDRTVVRLDIGTGGGEGTRVFFKFGPSF